MIKWQNFSLIPRSALTLTQPPPAHPQATIPIPSSWRWIISNKLEIYDVWNETFHSSDSHDDFVIILWITLSIHAGEKHSPYSAPFTFISQQSQQTRACVTWKANLQLPI